MDPSLVPDNWQKKLLVHYGLLRSGVSVSVREWALEQGFIKNGEELLQKVKQLQQTAIGAYLLQFAERLARAVGQSQSLDEEEAEKISALLWVALLNGHYPPTSAQTKLQKFQQMQFDTLPRFQQIPLVESRSEPETLWLHFADMLVDLVQYISGVAVRETWEENLWARLSHEKLASGFFAKTSQTMGFQLNEFHGRPTYVYSDWDSGRLWNQQNPVIPVGNPNQAFGFIDEYLAQRTYYESELLGGLAAFSPAQARVLTDEAMTFLTVFADYLEKLRR